MYWFVVWSLNHSQFRTGHFCKSGSFLILLFAGKYSSNWLVFWHLQGPIEDSFSYWFVFSWIKIQHWFARSSIFTMDLFLGRQFFIFQRSKSNLQSSFRFCGLWISPSLQTQIETLNTFHCEKEKYIDYNVWFKKPDTHLLLIE